MVAAVFPHFRRDLTLSRRATDEGTVVVVKDPRRDQFFEFPEEAEFIAAQLDGATPLETVRQRVQERYAVPVESDVVADFVARLDRAGLLEQTAAPPAPPARRVQGSVLFLRVKCCDPDTLFNRLIGKIGFFFTRAFVIASAGMLIAAVAIASANWDVIVATLPHIYRLANLPVISLIVFSVIAGHEFAHGLTCKRYGGAVHELGFMLIYFQPALYCNVSDAWLFPEKSKRLWVGFAGPYFELCLWACATIMWRLTDVGTLPNFVGFVVMTSSGLKTLLNFNPLIKLDGYYLLSDWLEISNLRARGFAIVGNAIRRRLGLKPRTLEPTSARKQRFCLYYGIVATVVSFALLGYAMVRLGALIGGHNLALLVLTLGLFGTKIQRRMRRLFGAPAAKTSHPRPKGPLAEALGSLSVWQRRVLYCVGVLAFAWFALAVAQVDLKVNGSCSVVPAHEAPIRATVEGLVQDIPVHEGQWVRAHQPVAQLANRDLRAAAEQNKAETEEARGKLRLLLAGPSQEELNVARAAVATAAAAQKFAQEKLARLLPLKEKGLLSASELQDAQEPAAAADHALAEAQRKLDLLQKGARPEEVDAARANVERLKAQGDFLAQQLRLLTIESPASGIVTTPDRTLKTLSNQLVKKGDLVLQVSDLRVITAQIAVSEHEIGDVEPGQEVQLKVRGYPEKTFHGKVTAIATGATGTDAPLASDPALVNPKTVLVQTEIDNPDLLLKPNMTGEAKIICGERRAFDLVARRLARTLRVEFWSWW